MNRCFVSLFILLVLGCVRTHANSTAQDLDTRWDTFSDTWVATDALGRSLPTHEEVGPLRERQVGIFYFIWLNGHRHGGPYDISRILAQDPDAMQKPDSPLWGPLHAPHHWGESIFDYYVNDDAGVLRKHAQMLSDAGVDAIFFDVSNQLTYRPFYMELLRVFAEFKREGGRPPQIAFLCPFGHPPKVVDELYRDLYEPGLYSDLWFRWEGRPLILADPDLLQFRLGNERRNIAAELRPGHTLGQSFVVTEPLEIAGAHVPTWHGTASVVLTLRRDGPTGERIASRRFEGVQDNEWILLELHPPAPPGAHYLEMSNADGRAGWWSHTNDVYADGKAFEDGMPAAGDRTLRLLTSNEQTARVREFFTFRKPQPDYFQGQTQPDMWSWLEVHPQNVFTNSIGEREQMSVGVAQNAVEHRLGSMSETAGARGRSYHNGARDQRPDAVLHGRNFAEQWEHALNEDPKFIFVTGWNEWIAGLHHEFNRIREPVMFVDQFDQEHSRDIEPMRGGHGDNYYYQMAGYIRRFKGARPIQPISPRPIRVDGRFEDWQLVQPEFRDTVGDPVQRKHRGWDPSVTYTNMTGRNDLVMMKVSHDQANIYFHVRTREPLTAHTDPNWMLLFIDADGDPGTGWLGYDFIVNRTDVKAETTTVERNANGTYRWSSPTEIQYRAVGNQLELAIPLFALGLSELPAFIDFKWADNIQQTGDWSDFTLNGDVAPNDRFNFRAKFR